jgi:ABC-type branched-subunit amino acid transport system substrate-binding protein
VPSYINQVGVIFDVFDHFYGITKQIQWKQPAVVSGANPYGISMGAEFINKAETRGFFVTTYQQFLGTTNTISAEVRDLTSQVTGLKDSKARVFVALLQTVDMQNFIVNAKKFGLFNPKNVWLCSDACAQNFIQYNITAFPNQTLIMKDTLNSIQGMLGVSIPVDVKSDKYKFIVDTYQRTNNVSFFTSTPPMYDGFYALGYALDLLFKQNLTRNVTNVVAALRNVSFAGSTGWVDFDSNCERKPVYDITNVWRGMECPECLGLHPTEAFIPVGRWNHSSGLKMYRPVHFFDGTTKIPDLNLHHPFDYFDCKDGRKKTDETGSVQTSSSFSSSLLS